MKTILLEGTDLSGKTTLAESVRRRLENEGYDILVNSGPINKHSKLVNVPLTLARRVNSQYFRELMYTISLVLDGHPKDLYPNIDFFMQERYFPSVMAYSSVFNLLGINRGVGKIIQEMYSSFDFNILVKTGIEARLERIKNREVKTGLDKMIEANPQLALDLEREIQKILCRQSNYFELDTDEMTVEEATEEICRRLV